MSLSRKFQDKILELYQKNFPEKPLSSEVKDAFLKTPRHRFITKYQYGNPAKWIVVSEHSLEKQFPILYRDAPLVLFQDASKNRYSTISQPSFVLYCLELLQVKPENQVFELGTGSGWNAALLGCLVGENGHVYSTEIVPELAKSARENVQKHGSKNVTILAQDGGYGYESDISFDRGIFTASSYDLPRSFFRQIKEGGLLLAIIKNAGGTDCLYLLKNIENHFISLEATHCGFVPMTGDFQTGPLTLSSLKEKPEWNALQEKLVEQKPFWWGRKGQEFYWKTLGFCSYLGIVEPDFERFQPDPQYTQNEAPFFGIWRKDSLVLLKDNQLFSYGTREAQECLEKHLHTWIDLGMPPSDCFRLRIYPKERKITPSKNQWLIKQNESQFLWSL